MSGSSSSSNSSQAAETTSRKRHSSRSRSRSPSRGRSRNHGSPRDSSYSDESDRDSRDSRRRKRRRSSKHADDAPQSVNGRDKEPEVTDKSASEPPESASKAKKVKAKEADEEKDKYLTKCKQIMRVATLVVDIKKLLSKGAIIKNAKKEGTEVDKDDELTDREFETYRLILQAVPGLEEAHEEVCGDPDAVENLCAKVIRQMNGGRNNDTNTMKELLYDMLVDDKNPSKDLGLPVKTTSKHNYGFHNNTMGELLCPSDLTWSPTVKQAIIDKKIVVNASEYPRFVYPDCECDAADIENGLFYGILGIKAGKVIFTSPSSIKHDKTKSATRPNNASLARITSMTPRTIAYTLCQVRFALSDCQSYSPGCRDSGFSLEEFYWKVVDSLEESKVFKDKVLAFWNAEIFGSSAGSSVASVNPDGSTKEGALERLRAQRAAKAALAAIANTASTDN